MSVRSFTVAFISLPPDRKNDNFIALNYDIILLHHLLSQFRVVLQKPDLGGILVAFPTLQKAFRRQSMPGMLGAKPSPNTS